MNLRMTMRAARRRHLLWAIFVTSLTAHKALGWVSHEVRSVSRGPSAPLFRHCSAPDSHGRAVAATTRQRRPQQIRLPSRATRTASTTTEEVTTSAPTTAFKGSAAETPRDDTSRRVASSRPSSSSSSSPNLRELAARTFVPSTFDPLLTGGHLQSILGFFLRESCGYVPRGDYVSLLRQAWEGTVLEKQESRDALDDDDSTWFWDQRVRIDTPDGDWFHADTKFAAITGSSSGDGSSFSPKPTVILLHGLCSSSNSSLAMDVATSVTQIGMDCTCLNFRGCSGSMNAKLGGYHLGFTDDLKHYLELMRQQHPHQQFAAPVYLVGYSLGANVVLKCLGELNDDAFDTYNIRGAVALCAPLDQTKNAKVLAQPGMQQIYTKNLLNTLKPMVDQQLQIFCDGDSRTSRFDYDGVVKARTITEFDEAFIAPVYGFRNAEDYYEQTSSVQYLDWIRVPTLIVNAKDDPFLDPSVWPVDKYCCTSNTESFVRMVRTEHGGHLGFCFHQVDDNDEFNDADDNASEAEGDTLLRRRRRPSWVAREAGRFLSHVHGSWAAPNTKLAVD